MKARNLEELAVLGNKIPALGHTVIVGFKRDFRK